jgi:pimeloyl-ACP methyl ester carboxylesterase
MATYVIVHGGWAGGWYFGETARFMRAAGHEVYTPTLTGIGERVHLGHADIDLNTHIQDIVNVLVYEDLHNVLLVGYSYGGMVITGVAEAVTENLRLSAFIRGHISEDLTLNLMSAGLE